MQAIEAHRLCQERLGKGSIMGIGGRELEGQRLPRAATEQRMHAVPTEERAPARLVVGRVADGSIWIGSPPCQDGGTVKNEIPATHQARAAGLAHHDHQQRLRARWAHPCAARFRFWARLGRSALCRWGAFTSPAAKC